MSSESGCLAQRGGARHFVHSWVACGVDCGREVGPSEVRLRERQNRCSGYSTRVWTKRFEAGSWVSIYVACTGMA